MTRISPGSVTFATIVLGLSAQATACSIFADPDVPFSYDHYVFYGEVVGHVSLEMDRCGYESRFDEKSCPPAWGMALKILEPVQVPVRGISQVEFFDFNLDSLCDDVPLEKESVEMRFPVGVRVKVVARPLESLAAEERTFPLTALGPTITSISILAHDANVRKLAMSKFDYVAFRRHLSNSEASDWWRSDESLAFETWRDKLRLSRTSSEREAFEDLLRMAAAGDLGVIAPDGDYSPIEKLVDQYLPTPALRERFGRQLRDARYDSGAMSEKEMLEVAQERAQQGDPRAMFTYGLLLHWRPMSDPARLPQAEIDDWIRRAASAGHLPAVAEWFDRTEKLDEENPVRREAVAWYRAGEARAMRAAKRGDPAAYLFLADLYSTRVEYEYAHESEAQVDWWQRQAERYSCLLDAHPEAAYWKVRSTSAWWYIECPNAKSAEAE
jgi:hypothetical protein